MLAAGSAAPRGQQRPLARAPRTARPTFSTSSRTRTRTRTPNLQRTSRFASRSERARSSRKSASSALASASRTQMDKSVLLGKNRLFHFDDAYPPLADQHTIYANLVAPLVESCFNGYNATVLAYGQTGSGKTYTMGSGKLLQPARRRGWRHSPHLGRLTRIERRKARPKSPCDARSSRCTTRRFATCYTPTPPRRPSRFARARTAPSWRAQHSREETRCLLEMVRLLENGSVGRTTGGTKMNAESSRSHAIFTIILEQRHLTREAMRQHRGAPPARSSISWIWRVPSVTNAPAPSGRGSRSPSTSTAVLALGNVISALSDDQGRKQSGKESETRKHLHVPYRESKLTRLLQDSLGGNSRTCMIACVSPTDSNLDETLNTLKYAARARNIRNKTKVNRDPRRRGSRRIARARTARPSRPPAPASSSEG